MTLGTNINADMGFGNKQLPGILHSAFLKIFAYTPNPKVTDLHFNAE